MKVRLQRWFVFGNPHESEQHAKRVEIVAQDAVEALTVFLEHYPTHPRGMPWTTFRVELGHDMIVPDKYLTGGTTKRLK